MLFLSFRKIDFTWRGIILISFMKSNETRNIEYKIYNNAKIPLRGDIKLFHGCPR